MSMDMAFLEKRVWQRWKEVRKAYYDDYEEVAVCLEKAYSVISDMFENNIEVSDTHNFLINTEMAQILIEGKFLTEAREHLNIAEEYIITEYNRSFLCWKKAELYMAASNKEEAFKLYKESLEYYKGIKKYSKSELRNELAIKHQMAKHFGIYKYIKEIILIYIELYQNGTESSAKVVEDTYKTFKELATENNDYMFLHKVNKELNLLKIVL